MRPDHIEQKELAALARSSSEPGFAYILLMFLSSVIATLGLLADSAPAIIGAMIIAPMMSPIMGLAYGLARFDVGVIAVSSVSILAGIILVIAVSGLLTGLVGSRLAGHEILSRTQPTLIDFGIALAAGCAAAFAHSRPSIQNSVAGVAIAVSLVPPLAVAGIGLVFGDNATDVGGVALRNQGPAASDMGVFYGALLLFFTNFVAILCVAALVFVLQGFGLPRRSALGLLALIAVIWFIGRPLGREYHEFYVANRVVALVSEVQADAQAEQFVRIERVRSDWRNGTLFVDVDLLATERFFVQTQSELDEFRRQLSKEISEPVDLTVNAIPVEVRMFRSLQAHSKD